MTADEIKKLLGLVRHPCEGGWYVRTYEASEMVTLDGYGGPRRTGTAIYYLLEPGTFSEIHRLLSDEMFHFYLGDAVEMLQLSAHGEGEVFQLGTDLIAGQRPQVLVKGGVWQGSRLVEGGAWALLGCTVSPGFDFADYESGIRDELCLAWPAWTEWIAALTRPEVVEE